MFVVLNSTKLHGYKKLKTSCNLFTLHFVYQMKKFRTLTITSSKAVTHFSIRAELYRMYGKNGWFVPFTYFKIRRSSSISANCHPQVVDKVMLGKYIQQPLCKESSLSQHLLLQLLVDPSRF